MHHLNDPLTHKLDERCVICATPLREPDSVELGIGPHCRKKYGWETAPPDNKAMAKPFMREASLDSCNNHRRLEIATILDGMEFHKIAGKIRARFTDVVLKVKIANKKVALDFHRKARGVVGARLCDLPFDAKDSFKQAIPYYLRTTYRDGRGKFYWAVHPGKAGRQAAWDWMRRVYAGSWIKIPEGVIKVPIDITQAQAMGEIRALIHTTPKDDGERAFLRGEALYYVRCLELASQPALLRYVDKLLAA